MFKTFFTIYIDLKMSSLKLVLKELNRSLEWNTLMLYRRCDDIILININIKGAILECYEE